MSDKEKMSKEDLKKLEDEAYFELCQIIAEALELQDIDLLNSRIASWKTKYKKLLDMPATNSRSDFKKRIEFLLNQYYSSVTQYILNQLKLKEQQKVENQAKAMRKLYSIIKDTNDLDLLKKKVKEWEEKYPVSGFLKMYQKRIELYTREKNLRENAFKQEEAFKDLVDLTKIHGTLDELKSELSLWEEKYSINNKYSIDDFIKHQSEVKRFTSDEFLQSIAREEPSVDNADKKEVDIVEEYNNKSFSDLSVQANAYTALLAISNSPNSINEMFKWVYKNSNIKFNDKYKELILSATYLNYSPKYLNKLTKPKLDMSKSSLSFDEYTHIDDIKKYAIISYFNLLLPPDKAISNNYFNKNIQIIRAKSEKAKASKITNDNPTITEGYIDSGIEIPLKDISTDDTTEEKGSNKKDSKDIENIDSPKDIFEEINIESNNSIFETDIEEKSYEEKNTEQTNIEDKNIEEKGLEEKSIEEKNIEEKNIIDMNLSTVEQPENSDSNDISTKTNDSNKEDTLVEEVFESQKIKNDNKLNINNDKDEENEIPREIDIPEQLPDNDNTNTIETKDTSINEVIDTTEEDVNKTNEKNINDINDSSVEQNRIEEENIDYNTVVAFSPLFFEQINNYNKQTVAVDVIDKTVNKYIENEKSNDINLDTQIRTTNETE